MKRLKGRKEKDEKKNNCHMKCENKYGDEHNNS